MNRIPVPQCMQVSQGRRRGSAALVVAAVLALVPAAPGASPVPEFAETFDSTLHRDALLTTARWDTTTGALNRYPFTGSEVGSVTGMNARDVVVRGDRAFVAAGTGGLRVVDITDPAVPTVIGSAPGSASFVDAAGDVALLGAGSNGLIVVDISDPTAPAPVDTVNLSTSVAGVKIVGTTAYVVGNDGFFVIDLTRPDSAFVAGSTVIPGAYCWEVAVSGNHAYVGGAGRFAVVDVTIASAPAVVYSGAAGTVTGVAVDGDIAYLSDVDMPGLRVFDVSDPAAPFEIATVGAGDIAINLALSGDWVYLATRTAGVTVIDVRNPSAPVLYETLNTPGSAEGVAVAGPLTFVADATGGLRILGNGNTAWPFGSAASPIGGDAKRIFVDGDIAYVAEGAGGVTVLDVADESQPVVLANLPLAHAQEVFVDGNVAYVANGVDGFVSVDVTDPANPVPLATILDGLFDNVYDLWVEGDVAHVLNTGLATVYYETIDITDPAAPVLAGAVSLGVTSLHDVVSEGSLALLATGLGLLAFDISDPAAPAYLGGGPSFTDLLEVAMDGDLAYAASADSFIVYDVSDPASIKRLGADHLEFPGYPGGTAQELVAEGDWAYVAADTIGLYMIDVADPTSPSVTFGFFARTTGIFLSGEVLHMARGTTGYGTMVPYSRQFAGGSLLSAGSDTVPSGPDTVRAIRGTVTGNALFKNLYAAADSTASLQSLGPGQWTILGDPGPDVRWYLEMSRLVPRAGEEVTALTLEYLYDVPVITEVADIPDDQGRQVRLSWTRSVHDDAGDPVPVLEYAVYRKIDAGPESVRVLEPDGGGPGLAPALAGWDYLVSVPADVDDAYSVVVPTLADSTGEGGTVMSTFLVRARTGTPGAYHESYPESGYSVDNLAPNAPQNLSAAYATGSGNALQWDPSYDADFRYFAVYRDVTPGFAVGPATRVATTVSTAWSDPDYDTGGVYYKLTAVDFSGNESEAASPLAVTGVGGEIVPLRLVLRPGTPNPFRSATTIAFGLPPGGKTVSLRVFDAAGRLVRTLIREDLPEGSHAITWYGKDDGGRSVQSGRYFYRLEAGHEVRTGSVIRLQ